MQFDAIVIGSGQAGTPLVFKLAAENQKVAFIEKEYIGGTCLNNGCTPTKAYVASARRAWELKNSEALGIEGSNPGKVNLKKVKERKDNLISKSVNGISKAINESNITYYKGHAKFKSNNEVEINNEILTSKKIFINVGGRPRIPESFEDVDYLTNKSILELEEIPKHLIIIGGSYIGLEFGQIFRRFGSEVTIVEMNERIISREDPEVSHEIQKILENEGIKFRLQATCLSGKNNSDGTINVNLECEVGAPEETGTHLLLAVGRLSNADQLGLENTDISYSDRYFIDVNEKLETSVEGIFAMGDCNGKGAFTHTSYNDYQIVENQLFGNQSRTLNDRITSYGLFVDPPLGRAGMTIEQAKSSGKKIKIAQRKMTSVARAREKGETNGFMNALIDAETDRILGATILGIGGDEIISSILNVMYADLPYQHIRDSVHPHPTVSELLPTMFERVEDL